LSANIKGILWRLRTGSPWRDLPSEIGSWKRVYNSFNRWSASGLIARVFESFQDEADCEWNMVDATINRVHQHAAGSRKESERAMGRSKGGLSTKVHMVSDAHGNPIRFSVTEGQRHDAVEAPHLLRNTVANVVIGDKGYDSNLLRTQLSNTGAIPVIPYRETTKTRDYAFDKDLYRARHVVENLFAKLKQQRAFTTRYDKLKRNYEAVVAMACTVIWVTLLRN
jgi:transposase